MITIVDYGMGNLRSVQKGLEKAGAKEVAIVSHPDALKNAQKLVLPGVGAFKDAITELERRNLISPIKDFIMKGNPFLGICLGLQIIFTESEEGGLHQGLDIIKGRVRRLSGDGIKVPHIGWNSITKWGDKIKECPLLLGVPDNTYVYFDHSYYVDPVDKDAIATETTYGVDFASMIWKDNIYATQFHPEKSQKLGLKILENFVRL
jgi:glutamine amidotransferase